MSIKKLIYGVSLFGLLSGAMPMAYADDLVNAAEGREAAEIDRVVSRFTLARAIQETIQSNPTLKKTSKTIDLAKENIDLARAGYRPSVAANGGVNYITSNNDLADEWDDLTQSSASLSLSQPLYRGGQTTADIEKNQHGYQATVSDYIAIKQSILMEVVTYFMKGYTAQKNIDVQQDNVKALSEELKATQARFDAGALTKTDVAQAKADLSDAKALLVEAQSSYETALADLSEVTGVHHIPLLEYPDVVSDHVPQTLEKAIALGLRKSPKISEAMAMIEQNKSNIDVQKGGLYPEVSLVAAADYIDNPSTTSLDYQESASVGISASLPLYQGGALRNSIRQAKIATAQAEDDLDAMEREVRSEIIAAWENYKSSQSLIIARQDQVEAAQFAYDGMKLEQKVGARSVLDVLDANQNMREAQLALIQAQSNQITSYYALLNVMGVLDIDKITGNL